MRDPTVFVEILRQHKRRVDILSLASIVLVIGLLFAAGWIADLLGAEETLKIGMYVGMASIVIVVCVWQAAAYVAASNEAAIRNWLDQSNL
jgi:uncharacterized membrane protein (DUF485 family)